MLRIISLDLSRRFAIIVSRILIRVFLLDRHRAHVLALENVLIVEQFSRMVLVWVLVFFPLYRRRALRLVGIEVDLLVGSKVVLLKVHGALVAFQTNAIIL
jgi:hypothetical protein